jgi:UTRA domain-containing protein
MIVVFFLGRHAALGRNSPLTARRPFDSTDMTARAQRCSASNRVDHPAVCKEELVRANEIVTLEIYRVGAVSETDAEFLEVAPGSPAFLVRRITSDTRGPYEFTVSAMLGDRYEIRSKLHV